MQPFFIFGTIRLTNQRARETFGTVTLSEDAIYSPFLTIPPWTCQTTLRPRH